MKRSQSIAILYAVLIFAFGVATGALGHRFYSDFNSPPKTAEDFRKHNIEEMRARLHLTPDQVAKFGAILDKTAERYRQMRERHRPEMVQIKSDQISDIKAILTPAQSVEYDKILIERQQRADDKK